METDSLAGSIVIGHRVMVLNQKRVGLDWIKRRNFLWWGWWNTGTGCQESW